MPFYKYTAKDKTGRPVSGVLESPDERMVINALREKELTIISIRQQGSGRKKEASGAAPMFGRRIKMTELVLFSRQMATMIESGIPLVNALDILIEQIETRAFRSVVAVTKEDVSAGMSFHDALARHPRAFSPLFVNMVKAGESSGALDDIMERLATYLEKSDSLRRKVRSALIYPSVVASMAVLITGVMMLFVIPVFKTMYADFDAALPLPTQILILISDGLVKFAYLWVPALVAAFVAMTRFIRTDRGAVLWDRFKLRMPIFGIIFRKVAVGKFSRTLATLLKSGVPILTALEIVSKTSGNRVIEAAVEKTRGCIREGETISAPLAKSRVFPPMVVRMIAVGEQTGELEKMLTKIADFYEDQVDTAVSSLTSLIEPLVIAFLGVVIGGIVICMFLPIFQLSSVVSQ